MCGLGVQRAEKQFIGRRKSTCLVNKCFLSHFNNGTQRALIQWTLLSSSLSHLIHIKLSLSLMVAPFLEQVLYLICFLESKGEGRRFSLSLVFLNNNELKIFNIPKGIFWVGTFCFPSICWRQKEWKGAF